MGQTNSQGCSISIPSVVVGLWSQGGHGGEFEGFAGGYTKLDKVEGLGMLML